jgi:hypothetical protein
MADEVPARSVRHVTIFSAGTGGANHGLLVQGDGLIAVEGGDVVGIGTGTPVRRLAGASTIRAVFGYGVPRPSATIRDRIEALDGYRAVGLLLVMAFHFGVGWLSGGSFGDDLFYVLSGYLITGLLVHGYCRRGRITLAAFWLRRARRLLPALFNVLVVVTLMVLFAEPVAAVASVDRFHAGTAGTPPREVVVLGDSTALTLGYALSATAPTGTTVLNGALFGCGLAIATNASNDPPKPELAMFPACNRSTPLSQQWPALDTREVAGTRPGDVVLIVAGYWETQDLLRIGRWTDIDQDSFRAYLLAQMRVAAEIGTAHGAHFDFTTMPAMASYAASHEPPSPGDSPQRRMTYDRLIDTVAREFPGRVSVINYGEILSPHGVFSEYLDGVQVRTPDGVHTPAYAPGNPFVGYATEAEAEAFYNWLSPQIWPLIIASDTTYRTAHSSAANGPT